MATFMCNSNPNFNGFLLAKITAIISPIEHPIIFLPAFCNFQSPVIQLLCHLKGIAFRSIIRWNLALKLYNIAQANTPEQKNDVYFA